jgi:hypothetical protein
MDLPSLDRLAGAPADPAELGIAIAVAMRMWPAGLPSGECWA